MAKTHDQARAESFLGKLAASPETTRAGEVVQAATRKAPRGATEKARKEGTLVARVGKAKGPQLSDAAGKQPPKSR